MMVKTKLFQCEYTLSGNAYFEGLDDMINEFLDKNSLVVLVDIKYTVSVERLEPGRNVMTTYHNALLIYRIVE